MTTLTLWQLRQLFVLDNRQAELLLTLKPAGASMRRSLRLQSAPCHMNREIQGKRLTPTIGYLDLPGCQGGPEQATVYAETAQRLIADIDQMAIRGWVIDLRRNTGGNMWPMIAGIGPILGEDEWLAFVAPEEQETAFYRRGQAGLLQETVLVQVEQPYMLQYSRPPVAVLTGPLTSSSGEFTALAFRGRPTHPEFWRTDTRG